MNADTPLEHAISEWQRKHHIADGDPMIAALELVRVYLEHSRGPNPRDDAAIPSFEDFRGTVELLDRRSKSFINQTSDLIAELRRFGQNVKRLNRTHAAMLLLLASFAALAGFLAGHWL